VANLVGPNPVGPGAAGPRGHVLVGMCTGKRLEESNLQPV
jgi:hypothetical protein